MSSWIYGRKNTQPQKLSKTVVNYPAFNETFVHVINSSMTFVDIINNKVNNLPNFFVVDKNYSLRINLN